MGNPHSLQSWGRSELGEGEHSPRFCLPVFPIHFPGLPGKDQRGRTGLGSRCQPYLQQSGGITKSSTATKIQRGWRRGRDTLPNLPPSSSVPQFPPSNAETPGGLWPCRNPPPADSWNNHIPKEYRKKTLETSPNPLWQQGGDNRDPPHSALHPSAPSPSTWGVLKKAGIAAFSHQDEWGCLCPGTDLSRLSWHWPSRGYIRKAAPV